MGSGSSAANMTREVVITSGKIAKFLAVIVMTLLFADLAIIYLRFVRGYEHLRGFIHGFYFDAEANFPSLYSALAILLCSVLLWMIGSQPEEKKKKRVLYWKFLSLLFAFLALDEFGSLHEYLITPMKSLIESSSLQSEYLYFAWFIPYSMLTLALAVVYIRFFFSLPLRTRWLFFWGAAIFLSGAVAMEMIGGKYWSRQGWAVDGSDDVDLNYALITTVEELLEMAGIIIFAYALSSYYLAYREGVYLLRISDAPREGPANLP